jgi:regulator of replication initiation timing
MDSCLLFGFLVHNEEELNQLKTHIISLFDEDRKRKIEKEKIRKMRMKEKKERFIDEEDDDDYNETYPFINFDMGRSKDVELKEFEEVDDEYILL